MSSSIQKIIVTGSKGFIGRHLVEVLNRSYDCVLTGYDVDNSFEDLVKALSEADVVFHLAGVNRPRRIEDYEKGNHLFTKRLCEILEKASNNPLFIFSSSIQAELNNPYGRSKLRAEEALKEWSKRTGSPVVIFRLKNVFGKWCRPNYNSVVATFCYNIARDLPIIISDQKKKIELIYIDDVIEAFLKCLEDPPRGVEYREVFPFFTISLGELAQHIKMFKYSRKSLLIPDFFDPFIRRLYSTYISYLDEGNFAYELRIHKDERGELAEFLKQANFGQIFVSRTKPGIIRGNHFHHSKVEKFLVIEGDAIIKFRKIDSENIIEYRVSGKDFKVVDIPPGYTHSIQNIGKGELITLFWASEVFNPKNPDTYTLNVIEDKDKERS